MIKRLLHLKTLLALPVFILSMISIQAVSPLQPITFEDGSSEYKWDTWGNNGDTACLTIVDNPFKTGVNKSDIIGKYICHTGSNSWAGMNIHDSVMITISEANKYFVMDVYKPNINKVIMALEQGDGAITRFDSYPFNTKTNEWETIVFDFSSVIGSTFYRLTIQPDLTSADPRADSAIVYLDNIRWYSSTTDIIRPLQTISFEDGTNSYTWNTWGNNGDTACFSIAENPSITVGNLSGKVGKYICHTGSNSWAGMNIKDSVLIDITDQNKYFAMDVYKPHINKVIMALEQGNGAITRFDSYPYNTKTNEWETLIFDFSSVIGSTFYRLTIQPDLTDSDPRADSSIVYLDNIRWFNELPKVINPLDSISFEEGTTEYQWDTWGNTGDTASLAIVDNPAKSDVNNSDKVGRYICHSGSNSWAGMNIHDSVIINITNENKFFTMDVYKPDITKVVMILEQGNGSITRFDSYPYNTKTNEWETMVFDFSSLVGNTFYRLTIQPDLIVENTRTDSAIVYLDNIKWYPENPNPVVSIGNFQDIKSTMYPNPAIDIINVVVAEKAVITLLNLNGQVVETIQAMQEGKYEISTSGLPKGFYFVAVKTINSNEVFKLLKE